MKCITENRISALFCIIGLLTFTARNLRNNSTIRHFNVYLLPVLLVMATRAIWGLYYGWLDDVLFEQHYRGLLTGQPLPYSFMYNEGLSYMYTWFYGAFPNVAWYGLFQYLWLLLALMGSHFLISTALEKYKVKVWQQTLILGAAYLLFWLEPFYLITYTQTALLCAGIGLLGYLFLLSVPELARWDRYAFFTLLVIVGFLTRPQVFVLPFVLFALSWWYVRRTKLSWQLAAWLPIVLLFVVHQLNWKVFMNEDQKTFYKRWPYIWSTQDGRQNLDEDKLAQLNANPKDSIRLVAMRSWFYLDHDQITMPFLEQFGPPTIFNKNALKHWRQNLFMEYMHARLWYKRIEPALDWWWKIIAGVVILLIIWIAVATAVFRFDANRKVLYWYSLQALALVGMVLSMAIFMKLENRVVTAMLILFFIGVPVFSAVRFGWNRNLKPAVLGVIIVCLVVGGLLRLPEYYAVGGHMSRQLERKRNFIEDMNTRYTGKVIMFDNYTRLLVHGTPFENVQLNPTNTYAVWGEPATNEFKTHREFLAKICGDYRFLPFFDCLASRKDVVLVYSQGRVDLIKAYADILYDRQYDFTPAVTSSPLDKIKSSFLSFPISCNYWTIKRHSN